MNRLRVVLTALALLVAAPALAIQPPNAWPVFAAPSGSAQGSYTVNPSNGAELGLAAAPPNFFDVDQLPDGNYVGFAAQGVFIIDPVAGTTTQLTTPDFALTTEYGAVRPNGTIYAGGTASAVSGIYEVNPTTGAFSLVAAMSSTTGMVFENDTDLVIGFETGGGLCPLGGLRRLDVTTGSFSTFASGTGICNPSDVDLNAAGNLVVTNRSLRQVIEVNPTTGAVITVIYEDTVGGTMNQAQGVAVNRVNGLIYVTEAINDTVLEVSTGSATVVADFGSPNPIQVWGATIARPTCSDALDNDGDLLIDFPNDPGCLNANGGLEDPQCNDGIDNDGQGGTDLADPGCNSQAWRNLENPQCQNGINDDNALGTDFDGGVSVNGPPGDPDGMDPHCANFGDNKERRGCGLLGIEPFLLLGGIAGVQRLRRRFSS